MPRAACIIHFVPGKDWSNLLCGTKWGDGNPKGSSKDLHNVTCHICLLLVETNNA